MLAFGTYSFKALRTLLSLAVLSLLFHCDHANQPVAKKTGFSKLTLIQQKEDFGTFGVLSGSNGMEWSQGYLYFSDSEQSRILVLERNLNVARQVGKPGAGPGEITLAGRLVCYRDRLFVNNEGTAGLSVFDTQGTFLAAIPVPYCNFATQFAVFDEMLFLSTPKKEKIITVADMEGTSLYQFGERFQGGEELENIHRSYRHLAIVDTAEMPLLIAVAESEPLIEAYTLDGVLKYTANLETHPLLQPRLDAVKELRERNPERRANTTFILIDSIAVRDQTIYLLVKNLKSPFHFLQFKVTGKAITYQQALRLDAPVVIHSYAVDNRGELFLYDNATGQLQRYAQTL